MPSEIKNILNTQFSRDTKIDYKTENRALSIWFEQWDTDKSGDFNDAEWAQYQKDLAKAQERQAIIEKTLVNKETVSIYTHILDAIDAKYKALEEKFNTIDNSVWDKLQEFEQKHPQIDRRCLADGKTLPDGAFEFDISALEVGIYDEEKDCYTGECYKLGYVIGLDSLTEDERNEYLQLLDDSVKNANTLKEYINELDKLEQEFDKYSTLQDMAETGVFTEIPSHEDENKLYSQYVSIRNNSNPFYQEIKDIEQKTTTLRLKGTKTDEDLKQIEQYQIQLRQLYQASSQWRLVNCDERPNLAEDEISQEVPTSKFQITELSGTLSINDESISEVNSAGINWTPNEAVNVNANVNHTLEFSEKDKQFTNSVDANLEAGYNNGKINLSSTTNVNYASEMTTYSQGVNIGYNNISANVTETIISTEEGNVNSTNASLSWSAGNYTTTGNAELTESGNTYNLSSSANYNISMSSDASLKISPEIRGSYNDATKDWMLAPTMNLYSEIKGDNVKAVFTAQESHVTAFGQENITTNHDFTATGNIEVKKWSFGTKFNDSDTPDSHSNTYGINIGYDMGKNGKISAEASRQHSRTKGSGDRENSTMFTLSFATSLDAIGKLFGLK